VCLYNSSLPEDKLSHIDESGQARMVDVSAKSDSVRTAVARGEIHLKPETLNLIQAGLLKKGDVLSVAQIAGVLAAKKTAELIPLCHPIPIDHVAVELHIDPNLPGVVISAALKTTGIEMEALTAVSVAALTVYDMVKAVEKTARIQNIRLVEKHGGQSGDLVNE
jgi:cyclic pyranopterin phosphate synthase